MPWLMLLLLLMCAQLLTLAVPRGPAGLSAADPGAVLALACHVVLVQAGLQVRLLCISGSLRLMPGVKNVSIRSPVHLSPCLT